MPSVVFAMVCMLIDLGNVVFMGACIANVALIINHYTETAAKTKG